MMGDGSITVFNADGSVHSHHEWTEQDLLYAHNNGVCGSFCSYCYEAAWKWWEENHEQAANKNKEK
jgi:hypothetical protein